MRKPYVVSEDIVILLERWAQSRGFALPDHRFISDLRESMLHQLEDVFGRRCVDMIPEGVLTEGMHALVSDARLPAISIDQAYGSAGARSFEINRFVDARLNDLGVGSRLPGQTLEQQVTKIRESGLREVVLVDDVIYTGTCMSRVIDLFRSEGIHVEKAVAGIVVGDGRHALQTRGVDVRWVRFYSQVIDEICERDFYPGVPYSGRAVAHQSVETGAPYLYPFGNPIHWASIPAARARAWSQCCLNNSIALWQEIEQVSGRVVRCCDLARLPIGSHSDETPFVNFLQHCLDDSAFNRYC